MNFKIELSEPYFNDLPPEDKSTDELVLLLLKSGAGESFVFKKYNEKEIHFCARKLIEAGLLRGTVLDFDRCSWSRLTPKGRNYYEILKKANLQFQTCKPS